MCYKEGVSIRLSSSLNKIPKNLLQCLLQPHRDILATPKVFIDVEEANFSWRCLDTTNSKARSRARKKKKESIEETMETLVRLEDQWNTKGRDIDKRFVENEKRLDEVSSNVCHMNGGTSDFQTEVKSSVDEVKTSVTTVECSASDLKGNFFVLQKNMDDKTSQLKDDTSQMKD